jgi:hypothetical protein
MNFITKNWPKAGLIAGLMLILYIYFIARSSITLLEKYAILNLAFLMFHQFEEYVLPGGFKHYFNNNIYNPMGFIRNKITDKAILFVNVVLGWGISIIIILFFNDNLYIVVSIIGVFFVNGVLHFFIAFKTRDYNPGAVTGAILFIPLTLYFINKLFAAGIIQYLDLLKILPFVIFGSLLIPFSIYSFRDKRQR